MSFFPPRGRGPGRRRSSLFVPLAFGLLLCSCSAAKFALTYSSTGDGTGKMEGRVYSSKRNSYRVAELSDGWRRVEIEGGDAAFHNPAGGLAVTVDSVCGGREYTLEKLSDSLLAGVGKKTMKTRRPVPVGDGEGLYSEYDAVLDGRNFGLATVVYKSPKCRYDFSYSASPADFAPNLGEFLDFVSGFEEIRAK